jgi:hypothetical protein
MHNKYLYDFRILNYGYNTFKAFRFNCIVVAIVNLHCPPYDVIDNTAGRVVSANVGILWGHRGKAAGNDDTANMSNPCQTILKRVDNGALKQIHPAI